MIEYRNPQYNSTGLIDCEINHPDFGWIPFTVNPADTGAQFDVKAFYDAIIENGGIAPYVEPEPPEESPE